MTESFSDLWASSNPVKSERSQPKTLGVAASTASNVTLRATPDAFSMLASTSSRPNSRPITPSVKPVTSKNGTVAGDAFGGLVSFGNSTSLDGGLTIAERAARAERERKERNEKDKVTLNVQGSFWDKYEDLPTGRAAIPDAHAKSNDLVDLDFLTPEHASSPEQLQGHKSAESSNNTNTWDFDFVAPKPTVNLAPPAMVPTTDLFDVEHLDALGIQPVSHFTEPSRSKTPGSFDFGDKDDQLWATDSQDEDDILGSLAKPVEAVKGISSKPRPVPSLSRTSSASPPPHIVGRIVEMGFSVPQARVALAATLTGLDVDAALEILLQHGGSTSSEERGGEVIDAVDVDRISRQRQGSSRATDPTAHPSSSPLHSESPSTNQQGLQEQADKLLAQASTIGMTMFSKANAFWKGSREKVVKVYEEQRSGLGAEAGMGTGRPRWMDNDTVGESGHECPDTDSQDRPQNKRMRPSVEAPPSALATSGTFKAAGTEHFKLGRFAEAEAAYSGAIDALPPYHLLRIPLYNNRALTRFRTGDYNGTIDDTTEVLRIITGDVGTAWHPGREEVGLRESFGDAIGKALRRRAEAYEGLEKWKDAADDWERLGTAVWVGISLKGDAVNGAGRCRQMAREGSHPTISPKMSSNPKPKPKSKSARTRNSPTRPSEALTRVRAANTAQEKEDQARHDLKDIVDARLAAWRTGKENNIRALIASLDVVLSPTFGWQTVGMSELVTPGQVKVKYTKAISKLHPDKLNVSNTTIEERMVANSVFGTLNEAWNAFR